MGVFPGVKSGVEEPIWLAGVSSHRDFLLLAPGVGVSPTDSSPLSVLGVSAQPLPCPGVSLSVFGVSSQRFLRTLPVAPPWPGVAWPGVSLPGVAAPAGVWLGVGSHIRELGVAPGVSLPLGRPGVSSHRLFEGVCAGVCPGVCKGPETSVRKLICETDLCFITGWYFLSLLQHWHQLGPSWTSFWV